jgi:hypothetical protein
LKNPNGSDIAGARALLEQMILRDQMTPEDMAACRYALSKLFRDVRNGRGKNAHRGWADPHLLPEMITYVRALPEKTRQQVSIALNCNTARVSEYMTGLVRLGPNGETQQWPFTET